MKSLSRFVEQMGSKMTATLSTTSKPNSREPSTHEQPLPTPPTKRAKEVARPHQSNLAQATKTVNAAATAVAQASVVVPTSAETRKDRLLSCPDHYHHTESEMLQGIERILNQLLDGRVEKVPIPEHKQAWAEAFNSAVPPPISLADYLSRLVFYLGNIPEYSSDRAMHSDLAIRYLLGAILYLERIELFVPGFEVTLLNIHRLLITGVLITAKVLDDVQPDHKYYAQLGGVSVAELCKLEICFLQLCEYNVNIDPTEFAEKYAINLMQRDRVFTDEDALFVGAIFSTKIQRAPPPSLEDII